MNVPYHNPRVAHLATLRDDWDSYGAKPLSPAALAVADLFAIIPGADGGVQLELHAGGMEIEISVSPAGRVVGIEVTPVLQDA